MTEVFDRLKLEKAGVVDKEVEDFAALFEILDM